VQVKIHELAVKEFDEVIEWYELKSKGNHGIGRKE